MTADEIWQAALGELQLEMTRATFDTWVKPTSLVSYQDGEMVIATPNQYAQEWLANRLASTVNRVLTGITGRSVRATFVVWKKPEQACDGAAPEETYTPPEPDWRRAGIPDRYADKTLDDLDWSRPVVQQAALRDYVQRCADYLDAGIGLHLYGPNGIGKTHLVIGLAKKIHVELGWTIAFVTWRGYLDSLREGYESAQAESEYRVLHRLVEVDLLVLDDLRADDL